ncbi:MAG: YopX family protein [Lactiplantibacillus plantarum]
MIKFRAWNKVDKFMTVPLDIQLGSDGYIYWIEAMGLNGEHDEGDLDVFKLEQFTGLKDVNGKDIYEGDIIKSIPNDPLFELSKFGVVTRSRIDLKWCYESGNIEHNIWASGRYRAYEVIGNVHENPDLLEESK